jgi:Ubiquitin-like domain
MIETNASPVVSLFVSSKFAKSERRFNKSCTIGDLKTKLRAICGVHTMRLTLIGDEGKVDLSDDDKMLGPSV